jgi:hypothetical protein
MSINCRIFLGHIFTIKGSKYIMLTAMKYKRLEGLTIQQLGLLHYFAKTKPWPRLPKLKQNQR